MPEFRNGQYTRTDVPALPGADGSVRNSNVLPRFFIDYRRNEKTNELMAVEMVQILIAGDTKNAPVRKVTDFHRSMWPAPYEAFKKNEEFIGEGTPVSAWGAIDAGVARSLQAMQIFTVEQLADIPDSACANMMGGRTLRDKAKQYVALTTKNAETNRVTAEMQAVKNENIALQNQVTELAKVVAKLNPDALKEAAPADSTEVLANDLDAAIDDEPTVEPEPPAAAPQGHQSLAERLGTPEPPRKPSAPAKRSRGRPKGSRNKSKEA